MCDRIDGNPLVFLTQKQPSQIAELHDRPCLFGNASIRAYEEEIEVELSGAAQNSKEG
jgi:hypothetical protein